MKKLLLTIGLAGCIALNTNAQTQPPNGGFETWVGSGTSIEPTNWGTFNQFYIVGVPQTAFQATGADAYSGTYALRLESVYDPFLFFDTIPGVAGLNANFFAFTEGMAYTDRPDSMKAFIKATVIPSDTCIINAQLTLLGALVGEATYTLTTSIGSYTKISVVFNYFLPGSPDTLLLSISAGGKAAPTRQGNILFIDDLSFVFPPPPPPPCGIDSSQIAVIIETAAFGSEVSWSITDATGAQVDTGFGYASTSTYFDTLCIKNCELYDFNMYDSFGDGWNGGTYTIVLTSTGDTISAGGLLGGSFGSDPFSYCNLPDAGITSVLSPVTGCSLSASETVEVVIQNFSAGNTIDSVDVSYSVDGGPAVTETVISTILPGNSINYVFSALADLSAPGSHTIDAWTELTGDINNSNDTGFAEIFNGNTQIAVIIETGSFGSEVSWSITDATGTQIDTGFGYASTSTYFDTLCINKCEVNFFNMYDSFGDGWNGGIYTIVLVSTGDTISTGGLLGGSFGSDPFSYCDLPDAGITSVLSPVSGCSLSASETVEVVIQNYSLVDTIDTILVSYSVDGGPIFTDTIISTILPGNSLNYVFSILADLSALGPHTIDAWTDLLNDADNTNDSTLNYIVNHLLTVSTYPYFEDFETGNGDWYSAGTSNSWAFGTPAKTTIDTAGSGVNSWVTGGLGVGSYNNNENSWVKGPCFDFSTLVNPVIALNVWWNSEFSWDGTVLQSSIDTGATWQNAGAFGDPNNWYTDNTINGNPGGQQEGWTGRNSTGNGSGGWVIARNSLTGLGGQGNVLLRIAFGSDGSVTDDGFAFDDVLIAEAPMVDLGADTIACDSLSLDAGMYAAYLWSTGDTTQTTVVTSTDTVSVMVWDSLGFSGSDTIIVTIINTPAVALGADTGICDGVTLTLDAGNPGAAYLWQDSSTAQTFDVTTTGTYYVRVSNICGIASDTIVVTVNPLPTVNIGADTSICIGDSLILDAANPGSTYLWNTGATTQTDTVNTTGWYSVNVTDINGCSNLDSINVLVITTLVVDLGADITICNGEVAMLDAGIAGADSYLWNTGESTQTITTDTAGMYTVEVNKCGTDTDTIIVIVIPTYSVNASDTICDNDSLQLPGGAYVNTAGIYYDTLTAVNGCDSVIITDLFVTPGPNAGIDSTLNVCVTEALVDVSTGLGGTPDGGGTWNDDDGSGALIPFTSSILPALAGIGTFNFTYVIAGTAPCTDDSATVTVIITAPPAGTDGSLSACVLETSLDLITGLSGIIDSTGTWNDDDVTGALTGSIFDPSAVSPGVYNFTYVVLGPSACDTSAIVTVTVVSAPNAGTDGTLNVCDSDLSLDLSTGLGGTPDAGGTWNDDDGSGAIIIGNTLSPAQIGAGTFNFTYIVSASGCPDDSATVTVNATAAPNAGTGSTLNTCDTVTVDLTTGLDGTQDAGGTWLDDDATGALSGGVFNPSGMGANTYNFTYVVAGTGGCANDSATVSVTVSICSGISEMSSSVSVNIYPNPNKGQFIIELTNTKKEDYLIEVRNIIGQLIFAEQIDDVSGSFTKEIDLSEHKGVYFLSISNSSGTRTEKLIVY